VWLVPQGCHMASCRDCRGGVVAGGVPSQLDSHVLPMRCSGHQTHPHLLSLASTGYRMPGWCSRQSPLRVRRHGGATRRRWRRWAWRPGG
jgi:hypothetical protein